MNFKAIRISIWLLAVTFAVLPSYPSHAEALIPDKDEKQRLKVCERQICEIIVGKKTAGSPLNCDLKKTWSKKTLKKGGKKSRVSWLFGDAQCRTDITMNRAEIIAALTQRKYKMWLTRQTINCKIVRSDKIHPLTIIASPKIKFKKGKARKVWLNVKKISGPKDIKGLIWTVANLEDSIGIFHRPIIKQINKFIRIKCPKIVRKGK